MLLYAIDLIQCIINRCNDKGEEELNEGVVGRIFDPFKFNQHKECAICLNAFEANSLVTVLPCDIRHYFHA